LIIIFDDFYRRSLYLLRGDLRFEYTHALKASGRRISIVFRDEADDDRQ
jgi:hypothetical protein|tara:strand:- start:699 stop:845 length:147 start_codon:yes stop_codon:yes gene_type:complete